MLLNVCTLYVLSVLKYKQERLTLDCPYSAFIRSKLEYAAIVWDSCTQELSDLIGNAQYRAGKSISGAIQ